MGKSAKSESRPTLVKLLQSDLQRLLEDGTIAFDELEAGSGHYCMVGGRGYEFFFDPEMNHKTGIYLLKLYSADEYWLSISLSFNTYTWEVRHIAISIYSLEKVKLFRAEWGKDESGIGHAQPHWHILYNKPTTTEWQRLEETAEFVESNTTDLYSRLQKIHFAMFASWHINDNHVAPMKSTNDKATRDRELRSWVKQVINYIKAQLIYLGNKSLFVGDFTK